MKRVWSLAMAGGLAASVALGQYPNALWTRPVAPPNEVLDRLNLAKAWQIRIPTDGPKDGIESIQNLGTQIIVQTRRGDLVSLDPVTGATEWRASVGQPYHVTHEVGYNDDLILATGATRVYAFDRANGEPLWAADLPSTPSSPPAADADGFYICLSNGRLAAYAFPVDLTKATATKPKSGGTEITKAKAPPPPPPLNDRNYLGAGFNGGRSAQGSGLPGGRSAQTNIGDIGKRSVVSVFDVKKNSRGSLAVDGPKLRWEFPTNRRIQDRPLLSAKTVLVVSTDKYAILVDKLHGDKATELPARDALSAPVGRYGEIAYAADRDGTVYCYDLGSKAVRWTFSTHSTSTIRTEPRATDEDVYINADFGGLIRLDRATGSLIWQCPDAFRFLAENRKYVYATDKQNHLLVIDRARGSVIANYDSSAFTLPIANDMTDRILLAAEDGTIVCLYDRSYPSALKLRAAEPRVAQSAQTKPAEEPKPEKTLESRPATEPKPKTEPTDPPEPKQPSEPKANPQPKPKTQPKAKGKG
ncbi:MAG: PQQ-binding-like beta-propeller repeat protein [Gemmataceae bacterium]